MKAMVVLGVLAAVTLTLIMCLVSQQHSNVSANQTPQTTPVTNVSPPTQEPTKTETPAVSPETGLVMVSTTFTPAFPDNPRIAKPVTNNVSVGK